MKLAHDKLDHFTVGLAIAVTLTAYGAPPLIAFVMGVAIGAGKEIVDPYRGGHRDVKDFIATAVGAACFLARLQPPRG